MTGKQSRAARSLLKWNLHDLANQVSRIQPRRIDSFEHGLVHLLEWENTELVQAFKKAGIVFKFDLEVVLMKNEADATRHANAGTNEGARIQLDSDMTVLSDTSSLKVPGDDSTGPEEQNRSEERKKPL